jgi:cytochrome P450
MRELRSYPEVPFWTLRHVESDPLSFLSDLAARSDAVVECRVGRHPAFLVREPDLVEDVLVRQSDVLVKGRGFERARRLLGNGLLTVDGVTHAARRRIAQPAFHHRQIARYADVVAARTTELADQWRRRSVVDVAREMQRLTLAIVGESLFSVDLTGRADEVRDAVREAMPEMDGLVSLVAAGGSGRDARTRLATLVSDLIAHRLETRDAPDDLLAMLLASAGSSERPLATAARAQIMDDALTFLLAGHDTIAHALTWAWMLLACNPDERNAVREEAVRVLGDRPATMADLGSLSRTRAVLAETLRLYPPAWVIVRRASAATRLGSHDIPQGAVVIVSPFVMHRDPRFFVDAERFNPARWVSSPPLNPRMSFLPFGAGPRACIGEGFAWMEGTLVLATLARRWTLVSEGTVDFTASPKITLRPRGPVTMRPVPVE